MVITEYQATWSKNLSDITDFKIELVNMKVLMPRNPIGRVTFEPLITDRLEIKGTCLIINDRRLEILRTERFRFNTEVTLADYQLYYQ